MEMTASEKKFRLFIDGEFTDGAMGKTFPDVSPVDGSRVAEVSEATEADVAAACEAAAAALRGPWGKMPLHERLNLLRKVADGIEKRFDEFLKAEIDDTGKPVSLAKTIDIPRGAANFRSFADLAYAASNESYETGTTDPGGAINYAVRVPLGVVGVICPWNLPLLLMTWKVAPALACGNAVVVKPSSETPASATLLAEVMRDAGVPRGVYNLLHGPGSVVGDAIVRHPLTAAVTFTGESGTGKAIMGKAAPGLKRLSFELGGKNPAIVFDDADLDLTVPGMLRAVFANTGQVCLCAERVYVQRGIFEKFVAAMKKGAEGLRLGDPYAAETTTGPLISLNQREKVLSYYKLAVAEGAAVVTGGGVPDLGPRFESGAFAQPTIWTGLDESARCVKEEIFGPVCHIRPFDGEEEAIALANNSPYGLAASVWTRDLSKAHRVAAALDVGIAWVNCWFLRDLRTPFGGMKMSGIGREGGRHSIDFYSEQKNICVKL